MILSHHDSFFLYVMRGSTALGARLEEDHLGTSAWTAFRWDWAREPARFKQSTFGCVTAGVREMRHLQLLDEAKVCKILRGGSESPFAFLQIVARRGLSLSVVLDEGGVNGKARDKRVSCLRGGNSKHPMVRRGGRLQSAGARPPGAPPLRTCLTFATANSA